MGEVLTFRIPRKLAAGERPRRDADRPKELQDIPLEGGDLSCIEFALQGEPKEIA